MWGDELQALLEHRANCMEIYADRLIVRRLIRGIQMGKLSALADRIKDTKAKLEAEADKLAAKLDTIDATAPGAFQRGAAFIDSQKAEVDEIESTLRQLSNLPLDGSTASPGDLKPMPDKQPPGGAAAPGPFPAGG